MPDLLVFAIEVLAVPRRQTACDTEVVRTKDLSSIIAAADDVVEPSGDLNPWFSSHRGESL